MNLNAYLKARVMAFDAACGVIVDELAKRGELDRTLVVISGDHGAPGFPRGKCNVHDFGSAVPLVLRWPEKIEAGRVVKKPVSLIATARTCCPRSLRERTTARCVAGR